MGCYRSGAYTAFGYTIQGLVGEPRSSYEQQYQTIHRKGDFRTMKKHNKRKLEALRKRVRVAREAHRRAKVKVGVRVRVARARLAVAKAKFRAIERAVRVPVNKADRVYIRALSSLSTFTWKESRRRYEVRREQRRLAHAKAEAERQARRSAPLNRTEEKAVLDWCAEKGLPVTDGKVVVYKRVSADYKTQVGYLDRETSYIIGSTVTHPNWNPRSSECGAGKYHACGTPRQCDPYCGMYDNGSDKYIALEVAVKDMFAWPARGRCHPNKIAFRTGKVLCRCNREGRKMTCS